MGKRAVRVLGMAKERQPESELFTPLSLPMIHAGFCTQIAFLLTSPAWESVTSDKKSLSLSLSSMCLWASSASPCNVSTWFYENRPS